MWFRSGFKAVLFVISTRVITYQIIAIEKPPDNEPNHEPAELPPVIRRSPGMRRIARLLGDHDIGAAERKVSCECGDTFEPTILRCWKPSLQQNANYKSESQQGSLSKCKCCPLTLHVIHQLCKEKGFCWNKYADGEEKRTFKQERHCAGLGNLPSNLNDTFVGECIRQIHLGNTRGKSVGLRLSVWLCLMVSAIFLPILLGMPMRTETTTCLAVAIIADVIGVAYQEQVRQTYTEVWQIWKQGDDSFAEK